MVLYWYQLFADDDTGREALFAALPRAPYALFRLGVEVPLTEAEVIQLQLLGVVRRFVRLPNHPNALVIQGLNGER